MLKISMLKGKSSEIEALSMGLSCDCKKIILNNYIISLRNFLIILTSLVQMSKYVTDENDLKCLFKKITQFQDNECFKYLYYQENISHKILFIFELLHNFLFTKAVDDIYNTIKQFINNDFDEEYVILNSVCQKVYELCEVGILTLSGLRLNALNLDSHIFENNNFKYKVKDLKYFDISKLKNCIFDFTQKCDPPEELDSCHEHEEVLHLFITEEYLKNPEILKFYIELLIEYHCNLKNICVILDYQLAPNVR